MKCYTVEKKENSWGDEWTEVVGNAVYSSEEEARAVAQKVFDKWLAENPHVGKNPGDEISDKAGIYRGYTRGQSVWVSVEEHEFVDGKRG